MVPSAEAMVNRVVHCAEEGSPVRVLSCQLGRSEEGGVGADPQTAAGGRVMKERVSSTHNWRK